VYATIVIHRLATNQKSKKAAKLQNRKKTKPLQNRCCKTVKLQLSVKPLEKRLYADLSFKVKTTI
jgi:hypothetical protein